MWPLGEYLQSTQPVIVHPQLGLPRVGLACGFVESESPTQIGRGSDDSQRRGAGLRPPRGSAAGGAEMVVCEGISQGIQREVRTLSVSPRYKNVGMANTLRVPPAGVISASPSIHVKGVQGTGDSQVRP